MTFKMHIQNVCQKESNSSTLTRLFVLEGVVDEGKDDPNTTESGPLSALQRWRFSSGPMMARHQMMARLLCDFSGKMDQYC